VQILEVNKYLSDKNLRITPCRVFVLNEFIKKNKESLSEVDLEKKAKKRFDRVTIYRTLKTFIDNDILHRVIDNDNVEKYALCVHTCSDNQHNHEHVHFKCESCNTTTCLDNVAVGSIDLPAGYKKREVNYLIIGTCIKCNS
jgi:Fur family ferric uptake transcriptional regulator